MSSGGAGVLAQLEAQQQAIEQLSAAQASLGDVQVQLAEQVKGLAEQQLRIIEALAGQGKGGKA